MPKLNIKHISTLIILTIMGVTANAQKYNQEVDDFNPLTKRKDKFGIRVGLGISHLNSPQLVNTKVSRGYQGAFYYRVNLFRGFHLNPEMGASIRGANFTNGDLGYTQISLFYFDFSMLGMIQLDKKFNHNIVTGFQFSRLMRSSLFVGKDPFPAYLQLPFKKWDIAAVVGYHYNIGIAGFQIALKYGFNNIAGDFFNFNRVSQNNNSQQFADLKPSLRNVKDVKNLSVELSVYF